MNNHDLTLGDSIATAIAESFLHPVSFAQFMEWALYHPQFGYYTTQATQIGTRGDFFTSVHLGPAFGELWAEQFVEIWELLDRPDPFTVVEMGAGQGFFAADALSWIAQHHPHVANCLDYVLIDRTPALIAQQQERLRSLNLPIRCRWTTLEDLAENSVVGCFFSNELIDAFPVHQVIVEADRLQEVYVTLDQPILQSPSFCEIIAELSTSELADYFAFVGIDLFSGGYPTGYRTEVNLKALQWIETVNRPLQRGYVITVDYGYTSDRYYSPRRSRGTIQCYFQHRHHDNPYQHIGQQDITAHVDFTALMRQGDRRGLTTLGLTTQAIALMALGVGDRLAALGQSQSRSPCDIQTALQQRDALHRLIDPTGLGNFGVLIQAKNIPESSPPLKSLRAGI